MPGSPSYSSYSYSYSRSPSPNREKSKGERKAGTRDKEKVERRGERRSSSSDSPKDRAPRRGKTEQVPKILHVSNLTRNVTADHLREIFSNFGTVKTVELAIDNDVQLPKGYAFVEYTEKEHVDAASGMPLTHLVHRAGGRDTA